MGVKSVHYSIELLKRIGYIRFSFGLMFFLISRWNSLIEIAFPSFSIIAHKETERRVNINDYSMIVDPKKKGIHRDLYLHNIREPYSTAFVKSIISKEDQIIDLGAGIGYYTILESKLANEGTVYAIEPVAQNIRMLRRNLELNECNNVSTFQCAISNRIGNGIFFVNDRPNWSSLGKPSSGRVIEEVEVSLETLDYFIEKNVNGYPNLIRMDIEGFEYEAMLGARDFLKNCSNSWIAIEIHLLPQEKMDALLRLLRENGFTVEAIFIEPVSYEMRSSTFLNELRKCAGFPEYGYAGRGYEDLKNVLSNNTRPCHVFFKKQS
jgi:FkbM family methyltransferase